LLYLILMYQFTNKKKPVNNNKVLKAGKALEDQLTPAQKKIWENVKQSFVELKLAERGKLEFRPVQELIDEL